MNPFEFTKTSGYEIHKRINSLKTSEYILDVNYTELIKLIDMYKNEKTFWGIDKQPELFEFQSEFTRVFHNYLASVKSLIDHTRTFKNKMNNLKLNNLYDKEKNKQLNDNFISFVQNLREFAQHFSVLPVALQVMVVDRNKEIKQIVIFKEDLLEFDGWKKDSKEFIEGLNESVNVESVTSDYQKKIKSFYIWLYKSISELYSAELSEFTNKYREFESIQNKFIEQIMKRKSSGTLK